MATRSATTRFLVGAGAVAGLLLAFAGDAAAAPADVSGKGAKQAGASTTTSSAPTPTTSTTAAPAPPTTSTTAAPAKATPTTSTTAAPAKATTTTTVARPVAIRPAAPVSSTITSSPTSPGRDTTPTWAFTVPTGHTTQCSVLLGGTTVAGPTACSTGTYTADLSAGPDGTYTFQVVAVETASGLSSVPATSTYTLDTTPPASPTITDSPTNTRDSTPTWRFALAAGTASTTCTLSSATGVVAGPAPCTSPVTYDLSGLPAGIYTFSVTASDALGNTSAPATSSFAYGGRGSPPPPQITSGPGATGNDPTPTWTFTTRASTTTTCELLSGSVVVIGPVACSGSFTPDLTALPDGTYTFRVVAYDNSGTPSAPATSTYTIDRTPATPVITGTPGTVGNDPTPTWTFTTQAGTTTTCEVLSGTTVVIGPVACSGSFTPDLTALPDGTYTFRVVARDADGRTSAAATSSYTLDRVAPAAPTLTTRPATPGNDTTPTWTFTVPAGASVLECTLRRADGTLVAGPTTCTSGTYTPDLGGQRDGTYVLTVVAIDAAGNRSPGVTSAYTLDVTPPGAPLITSAPGSPTNAGALTWTFTTPAGSVRMECAVLSGATVVLGPVTCTSPAVFDVSGLPDGTYSFRVVAIDAAGNRSAQALSSFTRDTTPPPAPVVTSGPTTTSDPDAEWRFRARGAEVTMCSLLSGTTVVFGPVPCGSPAAFDLTGLASGTYTFHVVAYDAAGNASAPGTMSVAWRNPTPPAPRPDPPGPNRPPPSGGPFTPPPAPPAPPAPPGPPAGAGPAVPTGGSLTPTPAPGPRRGAPPRGGGGPAAPGQPGTIPVPTTVPESEVEQFVRSAGRVAVSASRRAAFPLLLLLLVILFLIVQDQIDRRDPKLSQAPVQPSHDLGFEPPPTRRQPHER